MRGRTDEVRERFYPIFAEHRIKHPAVSAITDDARGRLIGYRLAPQSRAHNTTRVTAVIGRTNQSMAVS